MRIKMKKFVLQRPFHTKNDKKGINIYYMNKKTNILKPLFYLFAYFFSICHFQLFFEDSVRNIQAGKRVGLDTVLVSYLEIFCIVVKKSLDSLYSSNNYCIPFNDSQPTIN